MSSKVRITYYGVEGEGKNVTEAKKDVGQKIEAMLAGDYHPVIVMCRGTTVLVWRQPQGWDFKIIYDDKDGMREGTLRAHGNYGNRSDAMDAARMHLAQQAWTESDGTGAPLELDTYQQREFLSWARFQLRYQEGLRRGLDHWAAHSYAGRDPSKPHLWQNVASEVD